MRVLHLLTGEFFSGVEQVVLTLVRNHRRVEPRVVCLFAGQMQARLAGTLALEVLPMTSRADLTVIRRLIAFARRHDIQLLHAHTLRANLVAAIAAAIMEVLLVPGISALTARRGCGMCGGEAPKRQCITDDGKCALCGRKVALAEQEQPERKGKRVSKGVANRPLYG
jgi:hypothetical protein